jgi:diguanylate cyclase (GGDEF)-like protein
VQCWNATLAHHARRGKPLLAALLIAAGCFFHDAGATPPMRFERLGIDDGLAEQTVLAIAQDATGFMWLGTEDGLDRFDGYSFQHLRKSRGDSQGLTDTFVTDVQFGPNGRLWVATDGGSVVWRDPLERDFHSILAGRSGSSDRGLESVRVIRFDHAGRLWIGARAGGVALLDPQDGRLVRLQHKANDPGSLSDDSVFTLLEDHSGAIWVGTQSGLDRLELVSGKFKHFALDPGHPVRVHALVADRHGKLWIGTDVGLFQLDPANGTQIVFHHDAADARSLAADPVTALYVDSAERLWIGTEDGLALFDRNSGTFDNYRKDPADVSSLPDNHIVTLRQDRAGLLWIGTRFGGVARWNPRTLSFGQHGAGADEGMASRYVNAFTEDAMGRLWIGTFGGGITIVGPRTGSSGGPLADSRATHPITLRRSSSAPGGLSDDKVMALLTDHEGFVWVGTMEGGLDRIAPHTLTVTVFSHDANDPGTVGAAGVMSLLEDSSSRIWVGTYGGGLSRFDRATGHFQRYTPDPANPESLSAERVTALAEDRTRRIWVGTQGGGLNVLDPVSGHFFHLQHDSRNPRSLSGATVYSIYVDRKGTVWVGTRGGGLDRVVGSALVPEAIRFDNFNDRNGLPNNTIYGIHGDSAGRLWLSSNYGLARFDPASGQVRSFHRSHGLQEEEFNFGAHYAGRGGRLYFGGANGYNAFDPTGVVFDVVPPRVVLTAAAESSKPLPLTPRFVMPRLHYRDVVSFEFAALDFAAPRANQFAFKLEGFDPGWEYAGTRRTVTYTNLPDGHYTLRVRAANPDGVWSETGFGLPLDVDPPPWLSGWAYFGYTLVLAAIVALCWEGHRRSLSREALYSRRLKDEVNTRTRELAARNTELEKVNGRLEQASVTDPLTGLGNRRALIKEMPKLLAQLDDERRKATGGARMTLILVDLDRLKPINDEHGHEAGDVALQAVAKLLRRYLRETDRVVRWGGDEFVIVRTPSEIEDAAKLAEEIRASIAELRFNVSDTCSAHTTVSIGFACYPFVSEQPLLGTWEEVLNLADMALYRAKVRRDAWLGWCGLPRAARQTEIFRLVSVDPRAAMRDGYIDVRASGRSDDETASVKIPTLRVKSL